MKSCIEKVRKNKYLSLKVSWSFDSDNLLESFDDSFDLFYDCLITWIREVFIDFFMNTSLLMFLNLLSQFEDLSIQFFHFYNYLIVSSIVFKYVWTVVDF